MAYLHHLRDVQPPTDRSWTAVSRLYLRAVMRTRLVLATVLAPAIVVGCASGQSEQDAPLIRNGSGTLTLRVDQPRIELTGVAICKEHDQGYYMDGDWVSARLQGPTPRVRTEVSIHELGDSIVGLLVRVYDADMASTTTTLTDLGGVTVPAVRSNTAYEFGASADELELTPNPDAVGGSLRFANLGADAEARATAPSFLRAAWPATISGTVSWTCGAP
jgi:hypothetical protein